MKTQAISAKKRPRKAESVEHESRLIIYAIPKWAYADADLLGSQIDYWLLIHFKQFLMGQARGLPIADYTCLAALSPEEVGDRIIRDACQVARGNDVAHRPLIDDFSEFVLLQARTPLGFRLDLAHSVAALKRIWERQSRGMFTRYGEACECGARVAAGEQFASLDVQAESALKGEAVIEMDALRAKLRLAFPDSQGTTSSELLARIAEMANTGDAYPILRWCH
ncbi:MAG: hypothetical protein WBD59_22205, partial [Candidatus Sulfotelmatobacter sp.]